MKAVSIGETLCAVLMVLMPRVGLGAEWYVRPEGGNYGAADGTSFENAWNGLHRVKWQEVKPGNTVFICDTHVGGIMKIGASGTPGRRIVVRGDYPGHPGAVLGASAIFTDGWQLHDRIHNVWKRALKATRVYSDWHAFVRRKSSHPVKGLLRLNNVGRRETCGTGEEDDFARWKAGSYYRDGEVLYFRPPEGPANAWIYYAGYLPSTVQTSHAHHFDLRNLTVMMGAGSKNDAVIQLKSADHVTVDGVTVRWGSIGISFGPNWPDRLKPGAVSENVVVTNCTVRDCRCGIYPYGGVKDCRIARNDVHHIGVEGYYLPWRKERWYGDIHGIAIQGGGNGLIIEGNHVHHVGGEGIFPYGCNNPNGVNCREMRNFRILRNLVHDIQYVGSPAKRTHHSSGKESALYYNQDNTFPADGLSGNVMAYNVIYNANQGVRMKCKPNPKTGEPGWAVFNNVIDRADIGLCWYGTYPRNRANVLFRNNLVLNARSRFVKISKSTSTEYDRVLFDRNLYYPALPDGFEWPGGVGNFAAWRRWTDGGARDTGSMVADPRCVDVAKHDYRLLPGSPAVDAGVDVGLTTDHLGRAVPHGKAPDIGAHETGN